MDLSNQAKLSICTHVLCLMSTLNKLMQVLRCSFDCDVRIIKSALKVYANRRRAQQHTAERRCEGKPSSQGHSRSSRLSAWRLLHRIKPSVAIVRCDVRSGHTLYAARTLVVRPMRHPLSDACRMLLDPHFYPVQSPYTVPGCIVRRLCRFAQCKALVEPALASAVQVLHAVG